MTQDKQTRYHQLVAKRKACHLCKGLVNQAEIDGGIYDSDDISAWARWQGNLDARIMVVGQDWGPVSDFRKYRGIDPHPRSPNENSTNPNLTRLLASIGIDIDMFPSQREQKVFFTNAIACLKAFGKAQGPVEAEWFKNCGTEILTPLIDIVDPKGVVALGQHAYEAVRRAYEPGFRVRKESYLHYVQNVPPYRLPGARFLFAVYHCGAGSTNRNRSFPEQIKDWRRIKETLHSTNG